LATLESTSSQEALTLLPRMLVGRAPGCDLRIDDSRVSSRHAELRWTPSGWQIKDLGSRNGTKLDGRPLPQGQWRSLAGGAILTFGCVEAEWRALDVSPPRLPMAAPALGGPVIEAAGGVLLLPDARRPRACVRQRGEHWLIERGEAEQTLRSEDLVSVGEETYRIFLPAAGSSTLDVGDKAILGLISLEFSVSLDEEHVHLLARHGGRAIDLEVRAHHYLLLTLARLRLEDRRRGIAPGEEGWVYRDELMRMLGVDRTRLNIDVFRARRQLAEAGVEEAALLVERRQSTQQLRIGVVRLEVERA